MIWSLNGEEEWVEWLSNVRNGVLILAVEIALISTADP
jgi:hypothetical protein